MQWPISRSRVDKLGKKMRDGVTLSDEEGAEFALVLEFYEELAESVAARVASLGFSPTSRGKTTGTTIDKLRREHTTMLSRINDMAGVRIVVGTVSDQDRALDLISSEFADEVRTPQVIDRRLDPSHGYRAVHVIVYPENVPAEVQIRTFSQNLWAQIFESVADRWGRQIRYGEPPDSPGSLVTVPGVVPDVMSRAILIDLLRHFADQLAEREYEIGRALAVASVFSRYRDSVPRVEDIRRRLEEEGPSSALRREIEREYRSTRQFAKGFVDLSQADPRARGRFVRRNFPVKSEPSMELLEEKVSLLVGLVGGLNAASGRKSVRRHAELGAMLKTIADFEEIG